MIEALEAFLATNVGVGQVTVDGTSVRYERAEALRQLEYFKRQRDARKSKVSSINLGSAW